MVLSPSLIEQAHQSGSLNPLRKAQRLPGLGAEAMLVGGLLALNQQRSQQAVLHILQAAAMFDKRPDVQALLVQTLLNIGQQAIALRVLEDRLIRFPTDPMLLQLLATLTGQPPPADDTLHSLSSATATEARFVPTQGPSAQREATLDVLIPVYKGYSETLACIESVLRYRSSNHTPHEIIVLDDAGPDITLQQKLAQLANAGLITYVRRPANLGFIGNINRGMALHTGRDVVWLNSDTRVHGNWLDRLQQNAYAYSDVASVTPFSNNGLVMSVPEPLGKAPMPSASAQIALDQLAALLNQPAVEIPSGCGFCFYLRRDAIDDVGYLDEAHLKRGYEEETDWCLRARSRGWRHLGATNLYVGHSGGVSFGPEKALRVLQNGRVLRRRYPTAQNRFKRFVIEDPLKPARDRLLQSHEASQPTPREIPLNELPTLTASTLFGLQQATVWLIGDDLAVPGLGQRWLQFARAVMRQAQPCTLLLAEHTPWETELSATGAVCVLPKTRGITRDEALKLSGAQGCLYMAAPDRDATHFAQRNGIPLLRLQ